MLRGSSTRANVVGVIWLVLMSFQDVLKETEGEDGERERVWLRGQPPPGQAAKMLGMAGLAGRFGWLLPLMNGTLRPHWLSELLRARARCCYKKKKKKKKKKKRGSAFCVQTTCTARQHLAALLACVFYSLQRFCFICSTCSFLICNPAPPRIFTFSFLTFIILLLCIWNSLSIGLVQVVVFYIIPLLAHLDILPIAFHRQNDLIFHWIMFWMI